MFKEYVIIGGGAAGLSAAIRLAELGKEPLVIEGGKYPSHKICGEFFSPDCIALLKQWNIFPLEIAHARFHTFSKTLHFSFPEVAGSLSHLSFDPQLVEKLLSLGGSIVTEAKVLSLKPSKEGYEITLQSGGAIRASNLLIATGRIPSFEQKQVKFPYVGIKAHFEGLEVEGLEMFLSEQGYVGISPIENGKFNIAGLLCAAVEPQKFMKQMIEANPHVFSSAKPCFEWMTTPVPAFGIKKTPDWPHVYFIGDAAGTIPPITGNGLSLSIRGGILAAEFAIKKDWKGFKEASKKRFSSSFAWGKLLHRAALNPFLCNSLMTMCHKYPSLATCLYQATRRKENR